MTPTIEALAEAIHKHEDKLLREQGISLTSYQLATHAARVAMDMLAPTGDHEAGVERAARTLCDQLGGRCAIHDHKMDARAIIAAYLDGSGGGLPHGARSVTTDATTAPDLHERGIEAAANEAAHYMDPAVVVIDDATHAIVAAYLKASKP